MSPHIEFKKLTGVRSHCPCGHRASTHGLGARADRGARVGAAADRNSHEFDPAQRVN